MEEQSSREEHFLWENPHFLTPTFRKHVTVKLQKTRQLIRTEGLLAWLLRKKEGVGIWSWESDNSPGAKALDETEAPRETGPCQEDRKWPRGSRSRYLTESNLQTVFSDSPTGILRPNVLNRTWRKTTSSKVSHLCMFMQWWLRVIQSGLEKAAGKVYLRSQKFQKISYSRQKNWEGIELGPQQLC